VNSAAQSLAVELAPIRVNVVAPGIVRTPLWNGAPEAVFEQLGAGTLVGRVADPQDIAQVYLGLMVQNFTTGTIAIADGGGILK
jgi:NAD(P)-dependent dehydrogenase (short-subunit alcohol dehydrogenase family)